MNKCPPLAFEVIAKFFNPSSKGLAAMAEWLRRWTWNPIRSPCVGSNPARSDWYYSFFFFYESKIFTHIYKDNLRDLTAATIFSSMFFNYSN